MLWLIFTLFVLAFTKLGADCKSKKDRLLFRFLLLLLLSLMAGFGSKAGTDHDAYVYIYNTYNTFDMLTDIRTMLLSYSIEPGYVLLNILAHILKMSELFFFVFVSCLMNMAVVFLVFKFEKPVIAMLVFILTINYLQEINLVRQSIAISLFAMSTYFLTLKKYKLHFCLLFLAFTFHSTIIMCLPLSLIGFIDLNKYKRLIVVLSSFLWVFSLLTYIGIISFYSIGSVIGGFEDTRYESYANGSHGTGYDLGFNYMFNLLMFFVICSLYTNVTIYKLYIVLGVFLINLNIDVAMRMALYFLIFIPISCGQFLSVKTYSNTPYIANSIKVFKYLFVSYWILVLFRNYVFGNPLLGSTFYSL